MALTSSNVTSGFIDLATFDEIEKYLYGGSDATAYFVRETRKSTWFTQVPVVLSRASGTPAFNQDWSVSISRAGDYLLQTWLRLTTPSVTLTSAAGVGGKSIRWTRNFMHSIIQECNVTFNDLLQQFELVLPAERTTTDGQLIEHDAKGEDIAPVVAGFA